MNQELVNLCLERKDLIIEVLKNICWLRNNVDFLKSTSCNGVLAAYLDKNISKVLGLDYVDKFGYDAEYNGTKISFKSSKKMFNKNGSTVSVIDSNKIASSINYSDDDHKSRCQTEYYFLFQTDKNLSMTICSVDLAQQNMKETQSNTTFKIPDTKLTTFIIHPNEKIILDEGFEPSKEIIEWTNLSNKLI